MFRELQKQINYSPVKVVFGEFANPNITFTPVEAGLGLTSSSIQMLGLNGILDCITEDMSLDGKIVPLNEIGDSAIEEIDSLTVLGAANIYDRNSETSLIVEGLNGRCTVNGKQEVYVSPQNPDVEVHSAGKLVFGLSYVHSTDPDLF